MPIQPLPDPLFSSQDEFKATVTALLRRLHDLSNQAEQVRTTNPFGALRRLTSLNAALENDQRDYWRCLEFSWVKMSTKITQGVGIADASVAHNILAESLPFYLRLEQSRARVTAVIDYKRAYAVAILALYLSILSVVVSVVTAFR